MMLREEFFILTNFEKQSAMYCQNTANNILQHFLSHIGWHNQYWENIISQQKIYIVACTIPLTFDSVTPEAVGLEGLQSC